ncbi:hypothetical protein [Ketogulonicigenium vulgare]|uniref:hypothetical protein n=1 Tax=Ketogulonicigenium vulgare TaxID=92945 RepID=UPI00235927A8|nr:hypothetical protein [Ketogulonicigenium vulgare]
MSGRILGCLISALGIIVTIFVLIHLIRGSDAISSSEATSAIWPVIGIAVGSATTYLVTKSNSYATHVIEERRKWREDLRSMSVEIAQLMREGDVQSKRYHELVDAVTLRLNPFDGDQKTINFLRKQSASVDGKESANIFIGRVAKLLKFDWERVKGEASFRPCSDDKYASEREQYENEILKLPIKHP